MATRFTLNDIDHARQACPGGSVDAYLRALLALGVVRHTTFISDGHAEYVDESGAKLIAAPAHEPYEIAQEANDVAVRRALGLHNCKLTDYFTFSKQLAQAGINTWVICPVAMTCTYYSTAGEAILVEQIAD